MSHQPPANGDMPAEVGDDSESVLRLIYPVERESEDDVLEPAEEEQFGTRNPRRMLDPKLPSQREVDEHNLTHLPYRNWCKRCVFGKGRHAPHFKRAEREDSLAEAHFDYCSMSTKEQPLATVLVAKERESRR